MSRRGVQAIDTTLTALACDVLSTAEPAAKISAGRAAAAAWRQGNVTAIGDSRPPARPARPERPQLRRPGDMAKRSTAGRRGRIALLHAIAHIELNAIDLAWDLIARFATPDLPTAFLDDWVGVAEDEGRHFELLAARLAQLDAAYGDLPAHDGLWQAAEDTAGDLAARLAVVPMLLEARGLDVTPATVGRLRQASDSASADLLALICEEEIAHVAAGRRWFEWLCQRRNLDPIGHWRHLVARHFKGQLKPPFNEAARARAGLTADYYANWRGG
ncbi:MAG: ferritin-like domain-containing protein [Alphaproteobacteria bacterium]|nr:ferritin-like domain-containing protein [Alphaproteobacteria bacterium]MDP6812973.1 ferritin-like domain-containing protein [Alphaproteobacteria bacterium]